MTADRASNSCVTAAFPAINASSKICIVSDIAPASVFTAAMRLLG
jgi:hypothetical protein